MVYFGLVTKGTHLGQTMYTGNTIQGTMWFCLCLCAKLQFILDKHCIRSKQAPSGKSWKALVHLLWN